MVNFHHKSREMMLKLAKENKWDQLTSKDPYLMSFSKGEGKDRCRINIWVNDKNSCYTLGTYLNHPKRGKTQLFRKGVNADEIKKYFKNPRSHSGKGYYRK